MSSKPSADAIVDSVVLHYFLLAEEHRLLVGLLGGLLQVPRVVYDPEEEPGARPVVMSEMTRAIDYHHRRAGDLSQPAEARGAAAVAATRLAIVDELYSCGDLVVVDMTDAERSRFGALTNPTRTSEFGLQFPLDPGEAACVAVAAQRGWTIVTDDNDALTALAAISRRHPYERIRKLLTRAANDRHITRERANAIHAEMTAHGFWDRQQPFAGDLS